MGLTCDAQQPPLMEWSLMCLPILRSPTPKQDYQVDVGCMMQVLSGADTRRRGRKVVWTRVPGE